MCKVYDKCIIIIIIIRYYYDYNDLYINEKALMKCKHNHYCWCTFNVV